MTLEELYNKVMSDRDIMAEFVKASGTNSLEAFAKSYGCDAADTEIRKYFIAQCEGELPDDAVEDVAGGFFDFGKFISDLFCAIFGGPAAASTDCSVSVPASSPGVTPSSVTGGGMVNVGGNVPTSSVVGKGLAPTSGNIRKSSIFKKM